MPPGAVLDDDALTRALSALAGGDCMGLAARASLINEELYPQERAHVARAIPKRQAEFGTARLLARRALLALGVPAQALVPNADRSPSWPAGIVGSISHSGDYCAVVLSNAPAIVGIGLDLETTRLVKPDVQSAICTADELYWLQAQRQASGDSEWLDLLVFSAKESFYKCQYPLTRTFLGFGDVGLRFDLPRRTFYPVMLGTNVPLAHTLQQIRGQWRRLPGVLITLATLRQGASDGDLPTEFDDVIAR